MDISFTTYITEHEEEPEGAADSFTPICTKWSFALSRSRGVTRKEVCGLK